MKVIVCDNYDEMSKKAYEVMKPVLKDGAVIALATGTSPIGLYKCMAEDYKKGNVSYKNIRSVNLDEYVGQGVGDEQSYVEFMRRNLFNNIDIDLKNTDLPNGKAADLEKEVERYNKKLAENPIDIQVLGIGSNGHIGFNEPGTAFDSLTHVVDLTANTIKDMNAKKIVMVVNGANKAKAVKAMIEGRVTTDCPASILQLHPDCTVVLDKEAASLLTK